MKSIFSLVLLSFLLIVVACTSQVQSELGTRTVQLAQTVVAEGAEAAKTIAAETAATAASAAQTIAAETLANMETRLAEEIGSCPPSFDVDTDLNLPISVTGQQLDDAISSIRSDSGLIGLGDDIVKISEAQKINAYYIAAHAAWESSWGNSTLAIKKNNLFGYGAYDSCPFECAWSFASKIDSIEIVMENVKRDYLTEGGQFYKGPNLRGMNVRYATDSNWMNGIASIMNSLANKVPCN